MSEEAKKITANRQKKMDIVTELSEKFGRANAIVFTNYQGITHKQLEGFKKAIKPLKAEYVVAKNSLLILALGENKYKLEEGQVLDGQTGTLFLYEDVISPLKELAKIIKELNLPSVKFGIMEKNFITGEQVLKLSTLPTREVLLAQLVGSLKSPIFGLHRALNWNIQKLVLTLNAVAKAKPATAAVVTPDESSATKSPAEGTKPAGAVQHESAAKSEATETPASATEEAVNVNTPEPETILAETVEEKVAELQETDNPTTKAQETEEKNEVVKSESPDGDNKGGEN